MYKSIESLHPGNFAFVMATGIISVALDAQGLSGLSLVFGVIAVAAWEILLLLCIIRVIGFYNAVFIDLTSPRMVFSYFTLVAATNIVGILLHNYGLPMLAVICWFIAFASWCLLLYLAFSVLTFMSHENNVNIMHGGWLITIVGTQSLVLLGIMIAPSFGQYAHYMMVEVHLLWGLGLALYGIFVTLFCYRIFFLSLKPQDLSPLLWVVMGAAAISANAGTSLLESQGQLAFLANQKPFIDGITLMIWSWATWLIPLLTLFGIWKHLVSKVPFAYEPTVWSMVFPLGMYTVASERIGHVAEFPPMIWISQVMILVALLAWVFSLTGLLSRIGRTLTAR
ncbi:MAG: tellurite resistance/C4-dicarboxylate transporter family protein [Halioglobus sp.]|nr:tellurite resistance/C4-dicarboxylate transporter family protein [Halioglobus sp.]